MKKSFATIAGAVALVVAAAPSVASAQVPEPLPAQSIAQVATANGSFGTLLQAATAAGLAPALADCSAGPFTVFAPTDAAFAAVDADLLTGALGDPDGLLTQILNYHIVPGIVPASQVVAATSLTTAQGGTISVAGTKLNGTVNITATDIFACNGVIHVIDAVLVPALPSIAQVATSGGFNTLVAALTAANLASTFADCQAGPFTVFAPTDAAFAAALAALGLTAEQLLGNTALLTKVLQYHVVPGIAGAAEVTAASSLTSLQGEPITVADTKLNGNVNITATDNWACNGVVHVIDAVLLPPSLTAPATTTTTPTTVSPQLPATGSANSVMALIAGLLVLAGGGLFLVRRRPTA